MDKIFLCLECLALFEFLVLRIYKLLSANVSVRKKSSAAMQRGENEMLQGQ